MLAALPDPVKGRTTLLSVMLRWGSGVAKITDDLDTLLVFYKYPAEHWILLRTTDPIESTCATVRLRTKVTRRAGSCAAAITMA